MKNINRFKILFALWAILLGYCALISTNAYINVIMIVLGFCAFILGFAYIEEHMTEKEKRFFNKLGNDF